MSSIAQIRTALRSVLHRKFRRISHPSSSPRSSKPESRSRAAVSDPESDSPPARSGQRKNCIPQARRRCKAKCRTDKDGYISSGGHRIRELALCVAHQEKGFVPPCLTKLFLRCHDQTRGSARDVRGLDADPVVHSVKGNCGKALNVRSIALVWDAG